MRKIDMSFFNLAEANRKEASEFVRKYIEAMGDVPYRNRTQAFKWWDYDQLVSSPPADWAESVKINPDLNTLLYDASAMFKDIEDKHLKRYCTLVDNPERIHELNKIYIGFNTESGGYLLSIGPYKHSSSDNNLEEPEIAEKPEDLSSQTAQFDKNGKRIIVPRGSAVASAWDRIFYFVIKRNKPTAGKIANTVRNNIASYLKNYAVQLDPSDFYLSYTEKPKSDSEIYKTYAKEMSGTFQLSKELLEAIPPEGKGEEDEEEVAVVENLAPENPKVSEFLNFIHDRPMPRKGHALIRPNSKGMGKIMQGIGLGTFWKQKIIDEAKKVNKKPAQFMEEIMVRQDVIDGIYEMIFKEYKEAKKTNPASVKGIPPPPDPNKFTGKTSGQQVFTTVKKAKGKRGHMMALLKFRKEIIEALNQGITDPLEIAQRLNTEPERARRIKRYKIKGVSAQAVEQQLAVIYKEKGDGDMATYAKRHDATIEYYKSATGYDDFQTAFDMAVAYIATRVEDIDPLTGAAVGGAPNILGNIPENFQNYTRDDLIRLRQACILKEQNQPINDKAVTEETPIDPEKLKKRLRKDLGKELKPKVLPSETEVVPPGAEPEAEPRTPQVVPQTTKPSKKAPAKTPVSKKRAPQNIVTYTLKNLIKIASELDNEGKEEAAEEVHKIIRKYQERL